MTFARDPQERHLTAEQLKCVVLQQLNELCGSQLRDDATLIVVAAKAVCEGVVESQSNRMAAQN